MQWLICGCVATTLSAYLLFRAVVPPRKAMSVIQARRRSPMSRR